MVRRSWSPTPSGFIRDLPHGLVAAFRATLEETAEADLLLHVVDASAPDRDEQIAAVNKVLEEIGAGDLEQLMVFNKVDLTAAPSGIRTDAYGRIVGLALSAQTGAGVAELRQFLKDRARQESRDCKDSAAGPEERLEEGPEVVPEVVPEESRKRAWKMAWKLAWKTVRTLARARQAGLAQRMRRMPARRMHPRRPGWPGPSLIESRFIETRPGIPQYRTLVRNPNYVVTLSRTDVVR